MKKLLTILLLIPSFGFCQEQIKSMILHGDTLFLKNWTTGDSIQLNRMFPSQIGQVDKFITTNGTNYLWTALKTINGTAVFGTGDIVTAFSGITGQPSDNANLSSVLNGKQATITNGSISNAMLANGAVANLSGTNTGDNSVNTLYSGLAASKQNTITTGTTSQYFKGDLSLGTYAGYTLSVQALTSSPADGQTIYFGGLPRAPTTTAATSKVYIRQAGTIKRAEIYCFSGTAGTNEAWPISIRLNNTTDTQIASLSVSASERVFSNTSLNIAVVSGDYIEIKCVNPTWGTNPLTTIFSGYLYIE